MSAPEQEPGAGALPSSTQRAALASSLLLQTPPGQIANVYADLSAILLSTLPEGATQASASEEAALFQAHATQALESYNADQLVPFRLPGSDRTTLICRAAQVASPATTSSSAAAAQPSLPRYLDPSSSKSFVFDHFKLTASDIESHPPNPETEPLRLALQNSVDSYLANHFPDGVGAVFVVYAPVTSTEEQPSSTAQAAASGDVDDAVVAVEATEAVAADKEAWDAAAPPEAEAANVAAEEEAAESAAESAQAQGDDGPGAKETKTSAPEHKGSTATTRSEWAGAPSYVIHLTGNRFNPQNFWAGRWRSSYTYTPRASVDAQKTSSTSTSTTTTPATPAEGDIDASPLGTLRAHIALHVHYYEEGNVQLHLQSPHDSAFLPLPASLPSSSSSTPGSAGTEAALSKLIFTLIGKHEDVFQRELGEVLSEQFAERAMRQLRRALPVTRQRVDWDKLVNYQLGSELGRAPS